MSCTRDLFSGYIGVAAIPPAPALKVPGLRGSFGTGPTPESAADAERLMATVPAVQFQASHAMSVRSPNSRKLQTQPASPPPPMPRFPGARPPGPPPALTVEAVDDALRTLARIIRDHGDHLDRAALMTMAENLYAERARLERGKDVAAYMERLLQAAE